MGLLYSKLKVFRFPEKLRSLEAGKPITAPIHIRIKPTNVCGHSCYYCAYKAENLQLGKDMVKKDSISHGKMMEILDDVIEMGVEAITFSGGGEPFHYPHLFAAAERLANSPVKFGSLTNGSRLEGELAEIFAHNATWVRVSMDGWDDDSYVRYRRTRADEYTRILNNMENFQKFGGKCYLGVSLIIDRDNVSHIYAAISRLKSAGVRSVKVSPCILSNDGLENQAFHDVVGPIAREQIDRARSEFDDENFEVFDSYHELSGKFQKKYTWCPYLQVLHVIGADLRVYACQDKAYNLESGLLGSIEDRRYRDFWLGSKDKSFGINPARNCNHHCVSNEKNLLLLEYLDVEPAHMMFA